MQQMTTFHFNLVGTIHVAMFLPTRYVLTINETIQIHKVLHKGLTQGASELQQAKVKSIKKGLLY